MYLLQIKFESFNSATPIMTAVPVHKSQVFINRVTVLKSDLFHEKWAKEKVIFMLDRKAKRVRLIIGQCLFIVYDCTMHTNRLWLYQN